MCLFVKHCFTFFRFGWQIENFFDFLRQILEKKSLKKKELQSTSMIIIVFG
jgi:hypothetical protein